MALPVTAQDEMLRRIRQLDSEENDLRRKAGSLRAEAARSDAQAEAAAVLRRQFEFALKQLGGDLPPETAPPSPAMQSGRLVASLG